MDQSEPAQLRFLRRLVTALTLVMMGGVVTIVVLIVMRFREIPPPLPSEITLPDGARATSFTQGDDWFAVVTDGNEILIYDRVKGSLQQVIEINLPAEQ